MDWIDLISLDLLLLLCIFVFPSNSVRWGPLINDTNIIHIGQSASSSNTTLTSSPPSPSPVSVTLSPNGQIVNVQLDGKGRPIRAKNRTYESIRDIINLDQDYGDEKYDYGEKNVPGIDGDGNLNLIGKQNLSTNNDSAITVNSVSYNNTPSPVALPQISEYADGYNPYRYPNKPQLTDCPRIPSPTLTPSLPGRPRYVKIEWRKMILPPASSSSSRITSPSSTSSISSALTSPSSSSSPSSSNPSSHKVELVIPNDFSPFYYRKVVDYGPNPSINGHHLQHNHHHPQLMAIPSPPQLPSLSPIPITTKRNKKPSQIKFPNVFAGLMKSKKKKSKTKRPGFIYIPPQASSPYPPPPPPSYYYGPVNLPVREPWPAETLVKFARNLNSNSKNATKIN